MKKTIDFSRIADGHQFENLVADYFSEMKDAKNVTEVDVKPPSEGSDGGRDFLKATNKSSSRPIYKIRYFAA